MKIYDISLNDILKPGETYSFIMVDSEEWRGELLHVMARLKSAWEWDVDGVIIRQKDGIEVFLAGAHISAFSPGKGGTLMPAEEEE